MQAGIAIAVLGCRIGQTIVFWVAENDLGKPLAR